MKKKILAVDDDKDILLLVKYNLEREGYAVFTTDSGERVLEKMKAERPDLLVLDLMLPGMDGLEVCRALKGNPATSAVPIVMLTAKGAETDMVVGLEMGADDYITKPFSPKVLISRIRAIFRRFDRPSRPAAEATIIGPLQIDDEKREVTLDKRAVALTLTEYNLLNCLAARPGRVFTREELLSQAWQEEVTVVDRTVDVHMVSLRKKLGKCGDWIETVRGVGYRFQPPAGEDAP